MRLDPGLLAGAPVDRIVGLNLAYRNASAEQVVAGVAAEFPGQLAVVSSFGAEAAVLLDIVARVDRTLPVLLVDTLMLFEETLDYQRRLSEHLGLANVQHIRPEAGDIAALDPDGTLHRRDPDACCVVRKVAPLDRALRRWPVMVSGRKRFQAATRTALQVFEADGERLRVNPLAHWSAAELHTYLEARDLPPHPLVARGFRSIGCRPCTTPVAEGEDPRAGRWRGRAKVECGIHLAADGHIMRAS